MAQLLREIPHIEAGNVAIIKLTFTVNYGGPAPSAPTAMSIRVLEDDGVTEHACTVFTNASVWYGYYQLPETAKGRWTFRWESTAGAVAKGEAKFEVDPSSSYVSP
jgi:hypothetical protein